MRGSGRQHLRQPWRISSKLWPFSGREKIITVIDLGAHKVACAILACNCDRLDMDRDMRDAKILGHAVVRSAGIGGGQIINMAAAETCVRRAVAKAEAQAGITAGDVVVTASFLGVSAEIFEASFAQDSLYTHGNGLPAITAAAEDHFAGAQRRLLHVFAAPVPQKSGGTEISAISVPRRSLRQISACLRRSLLNPSDFIAGPVASAYAVTSPEEREAGVLILDIGAGSTGCAMFADGLPLFVDVISGGSGHITQDIAKTFGLKIFEAERLKIRHASVFDGLQADIDLPFNHGETGEPISKFALNNLVRSRVSSLLKAINERLKSCGYSFISSGVVLTGGGSLLPGLKDLASQILGADVRIGKSGDAGALKGECALSGLIGACHYVCLHQLQSEMAQAPELAMQSSSYAARISHWLRTSF